MTLMRFIGLLVPELHLAWLVLRRRIVAAQSGAPLMATQRAAAPQETADRDKAWDEARAELAALRGRAFRDVEVEIERLRKSTQGGVGPAGAGYVFLFSGDAGTGKSTLAAMLPRLLFGAGMVESSSVLDLRTTLPAGGEPGVWVADDADEVWQDPMLFTQIGRAFLRTNDKGPTAAMCLVGGPGFATRLARDSQESFWLMKCEIHDYVLPALSDDELVMAAQDLAQGMGFALDGEAPANLRKALARERGSTRPAPSGSRGFDGIGTVIQLLTQAKKAAVRQDRRTIVAADFI